MSGKTGLAAAHTMTTGDAIMGKRKEREKPYRLNFIVVENRGAEIARNLARREMEKIFAKHGVVCENWDEVLPIRTTEVMQNDQKKG